MTKGEWAMRKQKNKFNQVSSIVGQESERIDDTIRLAICYAGKDDNEGKEGKGSKRVIWYKV